MYMARRAQSEQAPRGNLALRHHRHAEALSIRRVRLLELSVVENAARAVVLDFSNARIGTGK
jgi:hypothetical protein